MDDIEAVDIRVDRGIKLLHEKAQVDWRNLIDIDKLDMMYNCILEMIYNRFETGMKELCIRFQSVEYGFYYYNDTDKVNLTTEWTRRLSEKA